MLVPDTLEWSGKKPRTDKDRHAPIEAVTLNRMRVRLPCRDLPKGRLITISTCTGLATPIMPLADHAWDFLELVEAVTDEYLLRGQIARVDFARDARLPDSVEYLREAARRAVHSGLQVEAHLKERQLGVTYLGVAGSDRLRIYHKGLETAKKLGWSCGWQDLYPDMADVVRVEIQYRKGQLDDRLRSNVRTLRCARIARAPRENDVPVIKTKPSRGHGIGKRHLSSMRRDWHARVAVEATDAVDSFLMAQELDRLIPGAFGTELPDPQYGTTPQDRKRR